MKKNRLCSRPTSALYRSNVASFSSTPRFFGVMIIIDFLTEKKELRNRDQNCAFVSFIVDREYACMFRDLLPQIHDWIQIFMTHRNSLHRWLCLQSVSLIVSFLGQICGSSFRAFARISYHFFNVSLSSVLLWSRSGHHGRWRRGSGSYAEEGKSWRTSGAQASQVLLLRQLLTPDPVFFEFKNPLFH